MSLEAITSEVERAEGLDQSIIALVNGLAAEIERLKEQPAALQALADRLRATNDTVLSAINATPPPSA